ncbi:hypothetical protein [Dysgonomonas sp. ZJ709]|uniref:hypothetical protein n=1 Tax=Dysgonomonas sp. ZJ709 TaxID=2709797 RepID=UPI0013EA021C|nr:hypothetical protein [Dysgonomonas sp. ZJ709]
MTKIPQTTAKLSLTPADLEALPIGATYQAQDGQATATVKKTDTGYEITANCDSLLLLVTDLYIEVNRLNKEKTELKTHLNEQKITEVNRLSGWQWFQIWCGRILLSVSAIYIGIKFIKSKIKK